MEIKKRINARKIVLSYFYQHCFFSAFNKETLAKLDQFVGDIPIPKFEIEKDKKSDFLDDKFFEKIAQKREEELQWDAVVLANINEYVLKTSIEEEFPYILSYFFDQWTIEDVDVDYVLKVGGGLLRYKSELIQKVDQRAEKFSFERMDTLDQVLLLLGYIEYQVLQTPKEILLNEMIELAKRYADEGAPKLVNGILHSIFKDEE